MHLSPQGESDYIGYVHPCIPALKVTWIEAAIAAPVFSGLVTYYVEWGSIAETKPNGHSLGWR